jgi:aspartyl protease family protein
VNELPHSLKLATVWLLLGAALFLGVQFMLSQAARSRVSVAGSSIEIQRGSDGHFRWPGRVNGVQVDFLVDTGATRTALPQALADRAGLVAVGSMVSQTAGGVVQAQVAQADITLDGGVCADRLRVAVLPALGAPLLGMDVLSKMHFSQQGSVLRIEAPREGGR